MESFTQDFDEILSLNAYQHRYNYIIPVDISELLFVIDVIISNTNLIFLNDALSNGDGDGAFGQGGMTITGTFPVNFTQSGARPQFRPLLDFIWRKTLFLKKNKQYFASNIIFALSTRLAVMKLFQHESDANPALIPQLVLFAPIQH